MSKYLDLDGLTLFKSKNDGLYETKANVTLVSNRVTTIEGKEAGWDAKQDTLTAGAGISISNNVISCTAGLQIHICQIGEYDPTTRIPTIQNPSPSTIYLVPKSTAAGNNAYDEWIYTNNAWEKIGSTEVTIETISNAEINALFA